jgi:hypothetical protein
MIDRPSRETRRNKRNLRVWIPRKTNVPERRITAITPASLSALH